jgi:hypothetical protein
MVSTSQQITAVAVVVVAIIKMKLLKKQKKMAVIKNTKFVKILPISRAMLHQE